MSRFPVVAAEEDETMSKVGPESCPASSLHQGHLIEPKEAKFQVISECLMLPFRCETETNIEQRPDGLDDKR